MKLFSTVCSHERKKNPIKEDEEYTCTQVDVDKLIEIQ